MIFLNIGINFRGCSGEPNLTNGAYHLGFTDDMKYFLSMISLGTNCPIYLVGFSLGANVILKLLGELGTSAKVRIVYTIILSNLTITK